MAILLPALTAFLLALITTPITAKLATRYGFVDDPKTHKHPAIIHTKIIPRAGGLALYFAIVPTILAFVDINQQIIALIIASTIAVIIGTLDDKYDLSPLIRLVSNFGIAAIVVFSGISIASITNPFGGIIRFDQYRINFHLFNDRSILIVADILAIVWIVWVMNMLNWSKGVDGQMPGIVIITTLVIALVGYKFLAIDPKQLTVIQIALITAGATGGFLVFNFHPAKIFPGYGATILGLIIASLSIMASGKVATAVLVLAVPIIDGLVTIARRIIQKKSPLKGDRSHLHHILLNLGWSQRQIALFYWVLCAILGSLALNLKSLEKLFVGVALFVIIGGGIIWLNLVGRKEN